MEHRLLFSAPVVDTIELSPHSPISIGLKVTITATAHDPAGDSVGAVRFYEDRNKDGLPAADELIDSDVNGTDGWAVTWETAGHAAGAVTLLAVAEDLSKKVGLAKALDATLVQDDHGPIDLQLSSTAVAEDLVNSAVGQITTTDSDVGDTFSYSLVGGTGDTDNALFVCVGDILRTALPLDFELQQSYHIRIRTTDGAGLFYEKPFTIYATDVNEPPSVTTFLKPRGYNASLTFSISDFSVAFTDPDVGDLLDKIRVTSLPTHGTLKLNGTPLTTAPQEISRAQLSALTYTPTLGYFGSDSFGWNGSDGSLYASIVANVVIGAAPNDFNHDGQTDIVWRNTSTGANRIWLMNGSTRASSVELPIAPNLDWQIGGTGDADIDGNIDIYWHNVTTGQNAIWLMSGTTRTGVVMLQANAVLAWRVCGIADLNADGFVDILFRNISTGANAVWFMSGSTVLGSSLLAAAPNLSWSLRGATDVNGDGKPDLLWRNTTTGANAVWLMHGTTCIGTQALPSAPNVSWVLVGSGDFDHDGHVDLLWHNTTTGANAVWRMDGISNLGVLSLDAETDLNWKAVLA